MANLTRSGNSEFWCSRHTCCCNPSPQDSYKFKTNQCCIVRPCHKRKKIKELSRQSQILRIFLFKSPKHPFSLNFYNSSQNILQFLKSELVIYLWLSLLSNPLDYPLHTSTLTPKLRPTCCALVSHPWDGSFALRLRSMPWSHCTLLHLLRVCLVVSSSTTWQACWEMMWNVVSVANPWL